MQKITLDARLLSAASLVDGDFVADVGTDHGFLPIYLAQSGKVRRAVASDIRPEPLKKARDNIEKHGLSSVVETMLTDGLDGLEKYPLTDVVIAGMGGMTVIGILEKAPFVKERRTHLIIQPMQHITETRQYLCENGFFIEKEALSQDDGKIYQTLSATYDGERRSLSPLEETLGVYTLAHKGENPELFNRWCDKYVRVLRAKIDGYAVAGADAEKEKALMRAVENEKI